MNKLSTLMLAAALAVPVYGCAHRNDDDGRGTTAQSTQTTSSPRAARTDEDPHEQPPPVAEARQEQAPEQQAPAPAAADDDATTGAVAATTTESGPSASTESGAQTGTGGNVPTAQNQPVGTTDEGITLTIRRALVADDSLGMRARNATIVTRRGVVTLRGSVERDAEREAIERHARSVDGVARVDNRIAIRP